MNLIPNWRNKHLRCFFCRTTQSVKYEQDYYDRLIEKSTKVYVCNACALRYKSFIKQFENVKVIVEPRKDGLEPAVFIIGDNVYMITITPDHNFTMTDEGPVGTRYDENGVWCGD